MVVGVHALLKKGEGEMEGEREKRERGRKKGRERGRKRGGIDTRDRRI